MKARLPLWFLALFLAGCALQRSDFVCGADGRPAAEPSPDGKTLGTFLRGLAETLTCGATGECRW
jgi:hypothetical protein